MGHGCQACWVGEVWTRGLEGEKLLSSWTDVRPTEKMLVAEGTDVFVIWKASESLMCYCWSDAIDPALWSQLSLCAEGMIASTHVV